MARRKKRAAPAAATADTPDQNKRKEHGAVRLQFQRTAVEKEVGNMCSDITNIGEKLIKLVNQADEEFRREVPDEIGNMTLQEFFNAGYMLDYGAPHNGRFVALGPLHYEIKEDPVDTAPPSSQKNMLPPRHTRGGDNTRPALSEIPETFSTPAPGVIPVSNNMFITPKVMLQPKRGHIIVYSENGSPYHLNLTTMKAKLPTTGEEPAAPAAGTRSTTRSTRATRATKRQ